jgi:hypothetical protein
MAPEIEWDVDTSTHSQTIVKTPPLRSPSPRNRIVVLLVVVFGVALGVMYRSIPEPPKPPTPTPTIVALPPLIAEVVDREVQALADGDQATFMSIQDQNDASWYQAQADTFETWGQAPATNPEYTVIETGTLADNRVWVDVRQWYGNFTYVRETRFYRLRDNRWLRTRPDVSFWSGKDAQSSTPHFDLIYPKEDQSLAQIIADRYERAYVVLCGDLHCEIGPTSRVLPHVLTMTLNLTRDDTSTTLDQGQSITITLPSPRLMRIVDRWGVPNDPIDAAAFDQMVIPIARIVSGGADRWFKSSDGVLFFNAIVAWERQRANNIVTSEFFVMDARTGQLIRLVSGGESEPPHQAYIDQLKDAQLVPLKAMWSWPLNMPPDSNMLKTMQVEASALIAFIQTKFGADGVTRFLYALNSAQSLPEAIEASFDQKYAEFETEWLKWIGKAE